MAVLMDFVWIMVAELTFILILVSAVNWLSNGFFTTWARVRMSKGRLWLVKVWTVNDTYFKAGKFDGKVISFKDRAKNGRRIFVHPSSVYRSYSISNIEVDEEKNAVRVKRKVIDDVTGAVKEIEEDGDGEHPIRVGGGFASIQGFDAVLFDGLIKRAMMLPKKDDNKTKLIVALLFVIVIGVAWIIYQNVQLAEVVRGAATVSGVV